MVTWKEKYNKKNGFEKTQSHSLKDIAKTTRIKKSILQAVYDRGIGAWKTNPQSVRNKEGKKREGGYPLAERMSKEQWGYARVFGFVGRNVKQVADGQPDNDLYLKIG